MNWRVLAVLLVCLAALDAAVDKSQQHADDSDFAEFEEFDNDEATVIGTDGVAPIADAKADRPASEEDKPEEVDGDEEDAVVEDEDSEFDHFQDEEEFEGFDAEKIGAASKADLKDGPKITITKVPLHLRTNWDSFFLEILMLAGLFVYFLNFFAGKAKNQRLANLWFNSHLQLLEDNFSLVGDDGKVDSEGTGLVKESENAYTLWCSGRTCCEGMLVELKLLKRQDLVAVLAQTFRPTRDQIHVRVRMNREDMDTFVFFFGTKRIASTMGKEMADLSTYCPEKKSAEKYGVPPQFVVMSEIGETTTAILDQKFLAVVNKYSDLIEYIHFSDQYSGVKQSEETAATKLPDATKALSFGFNFPASKGIPPSEVVEQMRPLLQLVFHCTDKVRRFRLSKEGKTKADKNRMRVEEAFLKTTHAVRAEAAAARREEKKRQEKERIMQEEDPEKQRKWEEREMRRQMKKKQPKMKQLRVKAL